jgi:hypothetical protein
VVCGGGIALARLRGPGRKQVDQVGMNLFHRGEGQILRANGHLKAPAILRHIFLGVPFHETEVEYLLAFECADPAGASAESVDQPWKFPEGIELQNLQTARFAEHPRRGNRAARSRTICRLTIPGLLQRCFSGRHNLNSIIATAGHLKMDRTQGAQAAPKVKHDCRHGH